MKSVHFLVEQEPELPFFVGVNFCHRNPIILIGLRDLSHVSALFDIGLFARNQILNLFVITIFWHMTRLVYVTQTPPLLN